MRGLGAVVGARADPHNEAYLSGWFHGGRPSTPARVICVTPSGRAATLDPEGWAAERAGFLAVLRFTRCASTGPTDPKDLLT